MYISQIVLRDWKAYREATFDFPEPAHGKNIILIGAKNGYGKTSLFEAIVICMFGRQGLPLIASSPFAGVGEDRQSTSYSNFLQKSLHKGAITNGRTSCSVKITFIDDSGSPLEIQRAWHFNDAGIYRPQDEEIRIYEGAERKPIGTGTSFSNESDEWIRGYINDRLIPFTLAHFFMFDGEQVSILAERDKSVQVRTGIEGLLGIPVLQKLAEDLRKYAEVRRKESPNVSDNTIEKLENERHSLTAECNTKKERLAKIEPERARLKEEQENLVREISSYGVSSQARLQEQFEQIKAHEKNIENGKERIEQLLLTDLAMAISGPELLQKTKSQLASEGIRERWETGKDQGDTNLENFISSVKSGIRSIDPALDDSQCDKIVEVTRNAWEKLWFPPPQNCAEAIRHPYMNENDRAKVIDQLDDLENLGASAVVELLSSVAKEENELRLLREELLRIEAIAPEIEAKREKLAEITANIQILDEEIGGLKREIESLDSQINQKNAELAKISSQKDQAIPSTRRSARANQVALIVDDIVKKAVPSQVSTIADAMTNAHKQMAHKKDLVDKIAIDPDCNVALLNAGGANIREHDISAGEKQVFTQALISAVSSVSGRRFPMLVDTPLGRLDEDHRKGVLNHLVSKGHQVILLSTDTEVVGQFKSEIDLHIQKEYIIDFELTDDIGESNVREGYFA